MENLSYHLPSYFIHPLVIFKCPLNVYLMVLAAAIMLFKQGALKAMMIILVLAVVIQIQIQHSHWKSNVEKYGFQNYKSIRTFRDF